MDSRKPGTGGSYNFRVTWKDGIVMESIGECYVFKTYSGLCFHVPWIEAPLVVSVFTESFQMGTNPFHHRVSVQ